MSAMPYGAPPGSPRPAHVHAQRDEPRCPGNGGTADAESGGFTGLLSWLSDGARFSVPVSANESCP
jgi:hypothetical protein